MCFSRQIPVLKNNFQSQCEVKDLIDYFCLLALKKGLLFKVKPAFTGFHWLGKHDIACCKSRKRSLRVEVVSHLQLRKRKLKLIEVVACKIRYSWFFWEFFNKVEIFVKWIRQARILKQFWRKKALKFARLLNELVMWKY